MAKERIFPFRSNEMIPNSPYRIRKVMGSGGMAAVYEAEDVSLQKRVVVKMLHAELADTPAAELMRTEARGLAAMHAHSNAFTTVLRTDDVDIRVETNGRTTWVRLPYYVMEPIDGPTLRAILVYQANRGELLAISKALGVARDVATALSHAHGEGIVHRDIKPENIMFHYKKNEAVAIRVIDFGVIGRMGVDANTTDHGFKGTLMYAAPEQLAERPVSGATDLYSLGVVMFEMLTGRPPFVGPPHDVAHGHLYATPPRISQVRPEIAPALVSIVEALLTKDPFNRVEMFRRRAARDAQHGLVLAQALEDVRRDLQHSGADAGAIDDVVGDVRRRARADHTTDVGSSSRMRDRRRVAAEDGGADGHASTAPGVDRLLDGLKRPDASEVIVGRRRTRSNAPHSSEASAPRDDRTDPMDEPPRGTPHSQRAADKTDVDPVFFDAAPSGDGHISLTKTQPLPIRFVADATTVDPQPPYSDAPITPSPVVVLAPMAIEAPPPSARTLNTTAEIMSAAFEDDVWQASEADAVEEERARTPTPPMPYAIETAGQDVESDAPVIASAAPRTFARRTPNRATPVYLAVAGVAMAAAAAIGGVWAGMGSLTPPLARANAALGWMATIEPPPPSVPPTATAPSSAASPSPISSPSASARPTPRGFGRPTPATTPAPPDTSELEPTLPFKQDFKH